MYQVASELYVDLLCIEKRIFMCSHNLKQLYELINNEPYIAESYSLYTNMKVSTVLRQYCIENAQICDVLGVYFLIK